jgi:hypothetical protein
MTSPHQGSKYRFLLGVVCIVMSQICAILFAYHYLGLHFIYAMAGSAFTWIGISLIASRIGRSQ